MPTLIQLLTVGLPVGYLALAGLSWAQLAAPDAPVLARCRTWLLIKVLVLHLCLFALYGKVLGGFPLLTGWPGLSAVALTVALLYVGIERSLKHAGTGGVVFGIVYLMQFLASGLGPMQPTQGASTDSPVLVIHTITSLAACAPLVLSGIHGALYLVLYRLMQKRDFGALFSQLPDLALLARMMRGSALVGFVLLTLGVNMGIWWGHAAGVDGFHYSDPFVLVMLGIWVHFGVVAFSRRIPGLTARRASFAAAAGFLMLLASLLFSITSHTFHGST